MDFYPTSSITYQVGDPAQSFVVDMSTVDDPTDTPLALSLFDCPEPKLFSSVSNLLTSSTANFWHQDGFDIDIVGDLHTMSIQTSDSNLVGDY